MSLDWANQRHLRGLGLALALSVVLSACGSETTAPPVSSAPPSAPPSTAPSSPPTSAPTPTKPPVGKEPWGPFPRVGIANRPEPDPALTPGAINRAVTQANIHQTICVAGYTSKIRPPESYTEPLKSEQIAQYGYPDQRLSDYEEDHLIPLEVGGAPSAVANLWPEPHDARLPDGTQAGSYAKDGLENYLNHAVCDGSVSLATAQHEFATDWVRYWLAAGRP